MTGSKFTMIRPVTAELAALELLVNVSPVVLSQKPLIKKHSYLNHSYVEGWYSQLDSKPQGHYPWVGLEVKTRDGSVVAQW